MENSPSLWNGLTETPEKVQAKINELETKGKQMDDAEKTLLYVYNLHK